jgi:hypothetical protein
MPTGVDSEPRCCSGVHRAISLELGMALVKDLAECLPQSALCYAQLTQILK